MRAFASVLTGVLIAAGAVVGVAAPAVAAEPANVSSTLAPRAGGPVTVTGAGFSTDAVGIYLGLRADGVAEDVPGTTVWIDDTNIDGDTAQGRTSKMNVDGSFSVSIPVPAYADGVTYSLVTRKAHGIPDPSQATSTPLAYEAAPVPIVTATTTTLAVTPAAGTEVGAPVTLSATVVPSAAGTVEFFDGATSLGRQAVASGAASLATTGLPAGTRSLTAVFTPADPAAFDGSSSTAAQHIVTEPATAQPLPLPTVVVSETSGLNPAGDTVTVTGSGFLPNPPATNGTGRPLTGFGGAYVVFGSFLESWKPSEGAPSSARKVLTQKWGVNAADMATIGGAARGAIEITPEGTFETTLSVSEAAALGNGNWGIYTYPGGGAKYAPFETYTPITFAQPVPVPTVTVTPATALDPNVENTLTVTGSNFTGPGAANGAYVVFGETGVWSGNAPLPSAGWITLAWVVPRDVTGGAFSTTITIPAGTLDPAKTYQIATSAAHRLSITDRSLDTFTPVPVAQVTLTPAIVLSADSVLPGGALTVTGSGFTAGQTATVTVNSNPITLGTATVATAGTFTVSGAIPASFPAGTHTVVAAVGGIPLASQTITVVAAPALAPPAAVEAPAQPTCIARAVSGATIQWSVKQSFRAYIDGPIANGSYSINWGGGSGAYSTETDRGRVSYGGSASFTGHGGLLDLQMSNPRVQVTGPSSANLILNVRATDATGAVAVNANGVVFATLSLPAASESGNRISWTGASATLTGAGAEAFGGFYSAGDALDPVSFAFPLGGEVECDASTGTLAVTGGDAPVDVLWLGLGILVIGAGVFALRRRVTAS